ncbi:MAG: hypothetical protein L0956_07940, partial [Candidatus Mariimomonas ferrooxydans]
MVEEKKPSEEKIEEEIKEKKSLKSIIKSLLDKWRSFRNRMPFTGKFIIAILLFTIVIGGAIVAYST